MNCLLNHCFPKPAFIVLLSLLSISALPQQTKTTKLSISSTKKAAAFPLVTTGRAATIYFDRNDETVVRIAAQAFVNDLKLVTGKAVQLDSSQILQEYSVIIGTIGKNKYIDQLISNGKLNADSIRSKWETFGISVIDQPFTNVKQALVIVGSDPRGTAFAVFELSKMIGVVPFYWWADVVPEHKTELFINKGTNIIGPPSVKYRGIFLNDEDWGLQPWAAKTFEPETGDIGPKTYARIFELLLRLKANLIWPAMHPCTKAFFHYPGNQQAAKDYAIVLGSSHAEPMLRNNVGEWDEKTMGHFNYITNKEKVYQYWEGRVKQSIDNDAVYTMGMRGVHDSKMEGVKNEKEAVPLLESIITDQRELLKQHLGKDIAAIPQVFTAYKEVLDIYDAGLKLPEDIGLVWPDDNYGYIQRLNNEKERSRSGGSGVYYHASYWGRPHDYLWLGSTHPALVREEMMKAYSTGANKLWVLNVGDIKPLEYNIEQFMDMAFDAGPFKNSSYVNNHLSNWVAGIFGKQHAQKIKNIMWQYYRLAFERRPEFMGWSQTEPTTKTAFTKYNHFFYGDEAQKRIDQYQSLENDVKQLRNKIKANRADAFYELLYYPVVSASLINKKFLYQDKAALYAAQNRLSANDYSSLSKAAYDSMVTATDFFNNRLAGGKWKNIMSMKPRQLPVFLEPAPLNANINVNESWGIAVEESLKKDTADLNNDTLTRLAFFDDIQRQKYFIDIFLSDKQVLSWHADVSGNWIKLSETKGMLGPAAAKNQVRVWVTIDWSKIPKAAKLKGRIVFKGNGKWRTVEVNARRLNAPAVSKYKYFIENNGFISFHAANFSRQTNTRSQQWQMLERLGYTGKALQVLPFFQDPFTDTLQVKTTNATLEYDFYNFTSGPAELIVFTLPTHPLNNKFSMRYAVSVDDGPLKLLDFKTVGRSEEWKQNVLSNRAERKLRLPFLNAGKHVLKVFAIDPAVILDEIRIDLGGLKAAYSVLPETK